jgi:hypothetical protein
MVGILPGRGSLLHGRRACRWSSQESGSLLPWLCSVIGKSSVPCVAFGKQCDVMFKKASNMQSVSRGRKGLGGWLETCLLVQWMEFGV